MLTGHNDCDAYGNQNDEPSEVMSRSARRKLRQQENAAAKAAKAAAAAARVVEEAAAALIASAAAKAAADAAKAAAAKAAESAKAAADADKARHAASHAACDAAYDAEEALSSAKSAVTYAILIATEKKNEALAQKCLRDHGKNPDIDPNSLTIVFDLYSLSMLWKTVFRCRCDDCACPGACDKTCDDWHHAKKCRYRCARYSDQAKLVEYYLKHHPFWDGILATLWCCPFVVKLQKLLSCLATCGYWGHTCEMFHTLDMNGKKEVVYDDKDRLFGIFKLSMRSGIRSWIFDNIFQADFGLPDVARSLKNLLFEIVNSNESYREPFLEDLQSLLNLELDSEHLNPDMSSIANKMRQDIEMSYSRVLYNKRVETFNRELKTLAYDISTMTSDALRIPDKSGTIKAGMIKLLQDQLNRLT